MKYRVFYKVTEYAYVDVEADNEEEAKLKAEDMADNGDADRCGDAEWDFDEVFEII
jgi:hypothetical protein